MINKMNKRAAALVLSAVMAAGCLTGNIGAVSAAPDGFTVTASSVEAKAAPKLNKTSLSLEVGQKAALTVKGATAKVKWSSKAPKTASVTQKGVVKGLKAGKTTVIAKTGGKTLKCAVTVTAVPLSENWAKGSANAEKIKTYVKHATNASDKAHFVPKEDRIAVFDMDGTLLCETYPTYYDTTMFVEYCLVDHKNDVSAQVKKVAEDVKDKSGSEVDKIYPTATLGYYFAQAFKGHTTQYVYDYTAEFGQKETPYFSNLKYGEAFYLPMVEMMGYLYKNGFTIYIVSGTERTAVRSIIDHSPLKKYVSKDHIIGTEFEVKVSGNETNPNDHEYQYKIGDDLVYTGEFVRKGVKASKVITIEREIGKKPVLAFGNSSGDNSMCYYTLDRNTYPSEAFLLVADDATRERGKESAWESKNKEYENSGINLVSMKDEFARIYEDGVMPVK